MIWIGLRNIMPQLIILFKKEDTDMIAMLWCQQIMLGKKTYKEVPVKLKDQVAELLRDSGCEDLITED